MFSAAAETVLSHQVYNYRHERRLLLFRNIPAQSSVLVVELAAQEDDH